MAEELFEIGNLFRLIGISWGYLFVIVIAGASLIIAYYHKIGKLVVRSPFGLPPKKDKETEKSKGEDSSDQ